MPNENANWAEWSKHVILSIERLDEDIKSLDTKLDEDIKSLDTKIGMMHDEVLQLRTRSSVVWSVLGAIGGALITVAIFFIVPHFLG